MDFANQWIGGGALGDGAVQEELMFVCHPELYVTMLLCEKMNDKEALGFEGFGKEMKVEGYGYSFKYAGREEARKG